MMPKKTSFPSLRSLSLLVLSLLAGLTVVGILAGYAAAPERSAGSQGSPPPHPAFPLLDGQGESVLVSGDPLSLQETCGGCHDTGFISEHDQHAREFAQAALPGQPEGTWFDPSTGQIVGLDAQAAGGVEMNCLLCHSAAPNNSARLQALSSAAWEWASTATLVGSGAVNLVAGSYQWDTGGFDQQGNIASDVLSIQTPGDTNCALCHAMAAIDPAAPVSASACDPGAASTTGQVYSAQRLADSGLDLINKQDLTRTWDAHAERILACSDCHYSLNNPAYPKIAGNEQPQHLAFDPRTLEIRDYLFQPLHDLAGEGVEGRECQTCHALDQTHDWLPYMERHFVALACQACHVPQIDTLALEQVDWTVLTIDGSPQISCRGDLELSDPNRFAGYQPVLLSSSESDAGPRLAPYNLVSVWNWVYGDPPVQVEYGDLRAAWLDADEYNAQVLALFDADADGRLQGDELAIRTPEQQALIATRLADLGLEDPRIVGLVQAFPINHSITSGEWAVSDCAACHGRDTRVDRDFELASYMPGGTSATMDWGDGSFDGTQFMVDTEDTLYLLPEAADAGLYLYGHDRVPWVDRIGALIFVGVLLGIVIHAGVRVFTRSRRQEHPVSDRVYKYGIYERLWHWLQTFDIVALLFTGLIIHNPDSMAVFSFRHVVLAHNVLAVILMINAALALFYHLASGEIRQYLPRPAGFLDQAILQAKYYLQGIFRGERHPLESRPDRKFNPLQQVSYIAILNVLLPLQGITGILMWGVDRWPDLAVILGGLPFLAPFHTLIAWLFGAFIVMHVYLTTTAGPKPLSSIEAMMLGWEQVDTHTPQTERGEA